MEPQTFKDKIQKHVDELEEELARLRGLAEHKKDREDALNVSMEITAHEVVESLERSLEDAKTKINSLGEITVEAWQERGDEIRSETEGTIKDLRKRFVALAESLKEQ